MKIPAFILRVQNFAQKLVKRQTLKTKLRKSKGNKLMQWFYLIQLKTL